MLSGQLRFQQCSDTVCEPPQTVPFQLPLTLEPFMVARLEHQLGSDRDGRFQCAVHRTMVGEETMDPVRDFALRFLRFQFQVT